MPSNPRTSSQFLQPISATVSAYPEVTDVNLCLNSDATLITATVARQAELLSQIEEVFKKTPSVARILHGDRRIAQGGRGRRTALFPSRKCGGHVPLESQLELAYAVVLERSPLVRDYRTQAVRIPLPGGRFAHPDFLIRAVDGTFEMHEVKPSIEHLSAESVQRFATIKTLLAGAGIGFRVVDARDLLNGTELHTLLAQYSRGHMQVFSQHQIEMGLSVLRACDLASLIEAYQLLREQQLPVQLADYLHFHQQWCCGNCNSPWCQGAAQ